MSTLRNTGICIALTALALIGCDGGTSDPDATIMLPDSGPMPFVGPGTCAQPRVVVGELSTIRLDLDTTEDPEGALDLGPACGNPDGVPRAPQEVIAYMVPGAGPVGVSFDAALGDTLTNFDTVIQVRRTCAEIPTDGFPPSCFDDMSATDRRSAGALMAEGGETLYFVVTGFTDAPLPDTIDRGPLSIEFTARLNDVPEVLGGEVRTVAERTEIAVTGRDADEDAIGVLTTFFAADGTALDLNGDGEVPDQLALGFDAEPVGVEFMSTATIFYIAFGSGAVALSDRLIFLRAATAELVIVDEFYAQSAPMSVSVRFLDEVGLGADCSVATGAGCTLGLRCVGDVCVPTPAIAALCESSTALTIETPTTTTTRLNYNGMMPGGGGLIESSCAHTPGRETVLEVIVPAGSFDLIASTNLPGTGATDTVVYLRRECVDRLSEPPSGCIDNISGDPQAVVTLLDADPGVYSIFVEKLGHPSEAPIPFELQVSLRPVLTTGAACDAAGAENRCAAGACPSATLLCP